MNTAPEYLPESIREMISVIGLDDTMVIVEERGGITLWLPSRPKTDHWLYVAIGKMQFSKLIDHYGTGYLNIPVCAAALQRVKEEQIIDALQSETVEAVARKFKMTDRGIRKLRARSRDRDQKPSPQIDIFNQ